VRYRTIWISDVHLGTRQCDAGALLAFLDGHDSDYLYLVGDIIDFWSLRRQPYWPQSHSDVVRKVLSKARAGTMVTLIPGNHDEYLRRFSDLQLGNIMVTREAVHRTADGRLLLILHGDDFDSVTCCHRWTVWLGEVGCAALLTLNRWCNGVRRVLGLGYWSLSSYLKECLKPVVDFVTAFETALGHEAARRGLAGVVCGHIHRPALREIGRIVYANCGDWVENGTAVVEHLDGEMALVFPRTPARAAAATAEGATG
jgi:UDP-2,3-diacylglucosamine pyrophosphatase LpxH